MYYSNFNPENRPEEQQPQQTFEATSYRIEDDVRPSKKKKRVWPKVTALCLACALLGGGAAAGIMALTGGVKGTTTVYQGDRTPTVVSVSNVTTKEPLTAAQIYATYVKATVGITTEINTNVYGQVVQTAASGSGFVISQDGYIVTNYHVIDEASKITVTLVDGKSYDATLVGGDEENDIAVLKVDATGLDTVVIGSSDNLVVGDQVYAIGNPLGELTFSLTGGYVSALDRNVTMSDGRRMNYIQTDTAINSGNSGGPLFDQYGQVVGIVSAKLSNNGDSTEASVEGVGFAIPIDNVWNMITDIMEYGYVTGKPYMGIINTSVSGEAQRYGTPAGAYVLGVVEDSCAAKAGLQEGDIITKLDDADITSSDDLQNALADYRAGDTATLTVSRSGQVQTLTITFDERTDERVAASQELHDQLEEEQNQQYSNQQQYGNGGGIFWPFGW
ncbi:trypsin-like peptidase domain-containing protein [Pseudoflavonifractor capillosus]|uniref:Trypsin-like peptidase domain-containing protein n=1 Tax=Pseudoflavonifractor capillosus TaxID=106588 RepID=A0A921SSR6_9FIRM|nr:trypsin-like peptidase domain-containing protein [Pseudoflavonifractor capillosus]HJG87140.1 trypsin-like peptidase domain-containing protein [Pseudoflavonifractor capillosus]